MKITVGKVLFAVAIGMTAGGGINGCKPPGDGGQQSGEKQIDVSPSSGSLTG